MSRHRRVGLAAMLSGGTLVMGSLVLMNSRTDWPENKAEQSAREFIITKQIKPKPKVEKKKPKPKAPANAPPPPLADLGLDLAGIDLGMGAYDPAAGQGVDEKLLGDTSNVVMTADMVDVAPQVRHQSEIEYPPRAKVKEIEGYVVLSLLIDRQGNVSKVNVLESDPPEMFDHYAERTVKQWLFEPAQYKGQPVETWANQTIRFTLG